MPLPLALPPQKGCIPLFGGAGEEHGHQIRKMFERAHIILSGRLFFRSFRGLRRRGLGVKGKRHRDGICGRVRRNFGLCALMSQNPISFTVAQVRRSEEHTSELQSLMRISYAVFCLKKKKKKTNIQTST